MRQTIYYIVEPAQAQPIWFSRVSDGMRKTCMKNRFTLQEIQAISEIDGLEEMPVAVVVICSQNYWTQHIVDELRIRRVMPILVGSVPEHFGDNVSGILLSRRYFIEKVMEYFINCNRRNMALVGTNHNANNDAIKAEVFLKSSQTMGLGITPRDIYWIDSDIVNCVHACLDAADRYDSIICSNDYVAVILLAEARKRGIAIPEALYVVGLGDSLIGRYTQPTLTSTSNDEFFEMGQQAVGMWQAIMANPGLSNMTITVSTSIFPRGSTNFSDPGEFSYRLPDTSTPSVMIGKLSQTMRNLENCLRACDELDTRILRSILQGKSNERIESELFIAHSSLHYRLKKLYQLANVNSRAELEKLFTYYLPNF